jgi:hypothetical protein
VLGPVLGPCSPRTLFLARATEVPVGVSSDLLVALTNGGSKMFNVSRIEARLTATSGGRTVKLDTYEYGQSLGPNEQRSFRFPMPLDRETPLGEYTLVASCYYNTRDKEPFVSEVVNEAITLTPEPPDKEGLMRMIQMGMGGLGTLLLLGVVAKGVAGGNRAEKAAKPKKAAASGESAAKPTDEWLSGTLAGSETRSPKKKKKA